MNVSNAAKRAACASVILFGAIAVANCAPTASDHPSTAPAARATPARDRPAATANLDRDSFSKWLVGRGLTVRKVMPSIKASLYRETRTGFVYETPKGHVHAVFFASRSEVDAVQVRPVTRPAPPAGRYLYHIKSPKTDQVVNANARLCWKHVQNVLVQSRSREICAAIGAPLAR